MRAYKIFTTGAWTFAPIHLPVHIVNEEDMQVAKYLPGLLVFHNNPPSVLRPRHRNRHVSSQIVLDSSGREHMLLNFYVQANSRSPDQDASYFESASSWLNNAVTNFSEFSWQGTRDWITLHTQETVDSTKDLFRYLSGEPAPSKSEAVQISLPAPRKQESPIGDGKGFWSSFAGLFGALRSGTGKGPYEGALDTGHGSVWQEGEVHADLVRVGVYKSSHGSHTYTFQDASGYFIFRYILVDLPSRFFQRIPGDAHDLILFTGSQSRNPLRIFVERTDGVRENEPVVRWDNR